MVLNVEEEGKGRGGGAEGRLIKDWMGTRQLGEERRVLPETGQ